MSHHISDANITSITSDTAPGGQTNNDFDTNDTSITINVDVDVHGSGAPATLYFFMSDGNGGVFNGTELLGSVQVSASGSYSFTVPQTLTEQSDYTIYVSDQDHIGHGSDALDTHDLTVDLTAPTKTATITSVFDNQPPLWDGHSFGIGPVPNGGATNDTTPTLSGTISAKLAKGEVIAVYRDGIYVGNATVDDHGNGKNWTFTDNIGSSDYHSYDYTVRVEDAAGNEGPASNDYTIIICFMAGTMIRTPDGERAVETLKRGDLVLTADGRTMPVSWLGRQTVSTVFADKLRVLPIRVKAGALGENVPCRDLLVSPDHALLVDGALIHAGALVNGSSVVREAAVPTVFTYYHVEVDDHSLILAENTPAETFVDNVDRLNFDNWAEHEALYPEGKAINELPYPRAQSHRQVPVSTRARLAARAEAIGLVEEGAAVA